MKHSLRLSPQRIAFVLGSVAVLFAALTLLGAYIAGIMGERLPGPLRSVISIMSSGGERNAPTWFAVVMLLMCGLVLGLIAYFKWRYREPYRFHWVGLSLVFVAMSAEEIVGLHERLNGPLRQMLGATSWLHYGWVIAGAVAVGLFIVIFFRFWLHLDSRTRWLFALAAFLYVVGSIGFEMLGAQILTARGGPSLRFWFFATMEELGEMLGAVVFLYALLGYVAQYVVEVSVQVTDYRETDLSDAVGTSGQNRIVGASKPVPVKVNTVTRQPRQ